MNSEDSGPGTAAGEGKSAATREPVRRAVARSRGNGAAADGHPSRSASNGRQSFEALLQEHRELLRVCSSLQEEVSLLEEQVKLASRLVDYDALTELPNRRLLRERFTQASILGKRHQQKLALLFLDLDDFKRVNDELGHVTGDRLLQQVAIRLTQCIRASDTACRFGGDEFVVLLTELNDRAGALTAVKTVLARLSAPYVIDGTSIQLSASVGVAIHPDDGVDYSELVRHSDRSMYRHKNCKTHRRRARAIPDEVRT